MRYWIFSLMMALVALIVLPSATQGQVVARYYSQNTYPDYYSNYNALNQSLYHQRLRNYNALRYGQGYVSPYQYPNSLSNRSYYSGLRHRSYHRGLTPPYYDPYYNPYSEYNRSGVYYNSPGFGFRFSF